MLFNADGEDLERRMATPSAEFLCAFVAAAVRLRLENLIPER